MTNGDSQNQTTNIEPSDIGIVEATDEMISEIFLETFGYLL